MTPQNISGTLHFFDGATTYSACSGTKTHVGHYWFIGPCLVGVDDDVYLESTTHNMYIDSGVVPNSNTKMFIDLQYLDGTAIYNYMGVRRIDDVGVNFSILSFRGSNTFGAWVNDIHYSGITFDSQRHTFELSLREGYVVDRMYHYDVNNFNLDTDLTVHIFGDHANYMYGKVYRAKIWENDVLVRDFISVPSGMLIGTYIVPSNGMWDIVEQKFYGNSGTGDFVYGIDE